MSKNVESGKYDERCNCRRGDNRHERRFAVAFLKYMALRGIPGRRAQYYNQKPGDSLALNHSGFWSEQIYKQAERQELKMKIRQGCKFNTSKDITDMAENGFYTTTKKGLWCPFKPVLCQEGYCEECQIYITWQEEK